MANLKVNSKENFAASQTGGGLGFRRSNGTQSQRRLPSIKRPIAASVSMQGWLHKQGSEGLMLWKKRWFVLSEYCLYYYKNSDEEKVLGSILLPSYKVSPCTTVEGKLFRKKFSFKAEHANMRTYYFAADSREKMVQWMNAMSLASIAQDQSVGKNESRKTNTLAPGARNKNMTVGFSIPNNWPRNVVMNNGLPNGTHAHNHNQNHHYHPAGGNNVENYVQPLYVNAPPKPRRIGEPSESAYDRAVPAPATKVPADPSQERPPIRHHLSNRMLAHVDCADRRTPDAYGTSPCFDGHASSPSRASNQLLISDYEELYNLASAYDQYDSSAASSRSTANPVVAAAYAGQQPPLKPTALLNRPRSVDFLQSHDGAVNGSRVAPEQRRSNAAFGAARCNGGDRPAYVPPPRPKSSIEVVNSDGYHWSEEQYAESMRKSAQFLVAKTSSSALTKCMAENKLLQSGKMRSPSDGTASTDSEPAGARKANQFIVANHVAPRAATAYKKCNTAYPTSNGAAQNDFTRSKSARICREKQYDDSVEKSGDESAYKRKNSWHSKEHGERSNQQVQQREESMKRLLEWKQRMLQSPLTRKSAGSGRRDDAKNELFKNKVKSSVDDSSYQISCASPVSSLSDKQPDRLNELNGHEETLQRSRDFPLKTTPIIEHYDRRAQNFGPPVIEVPAPYIHNDTCGETIKMYRAPSSSAIRETAKPSISASSARTVNLQMLNNSNNSFTSSSSSAAYGDGKTDTIGVESNSSTKEMIPNQDEVSRPTVQDFNDPVSKSICQSSTNEVDCAKINTRSYEFPPQNIVQNRIKVFEKSPDTRAEERPHSSCSTLPARESPLNSSRNFSAFSDVCSESTFEAKHIDEGSNYRKEERLPGSKMACPSARDLLLNLDWQIMPPNSPTSSKSFENDLHRADAPADKPPLPPETNESKSSEKCDHDSSPEDHYLPMAPCKKTVFNGPNDLFYHTRSNSASSASQIMILETLLSEDVENSYVEMTVGEDRMIAKSLKNFSSDCDNVENKCDSDKSHYEFLYKASSTPNEPLYMEVTTKEKSAKSESIPENAAGANTNSTLPDILNSSNTLRMLTDSSDADDEASKELDPLEVPQHPRFSLSDTFRPASYYLGGGLSDRNALGLNFDQPDSSDSDLVSPPSIPTSPPPLDDFSVPSMDMSLPLAQSTGMPSQVPLSPPTSPLSMCKETRRSDFEDSCSSVIENILPSETESFDSKISALSLTKKFGLERCAFDLDSPVDSYVDHQMADGALFESSRSQYQHFPPSTSHFSVESRPIVEIVPPCDDLPEPEDESTTVASSVATSSTMNAPLGSILDNHLGAPYYYADLLKASDDDRVAERKNELCLSTASSKNILPNNQRENNFEYANAYKRNDIGKKVNQIGEEDRAVSRPIMDKNAICASASAAPKYIEDKNIYSSDIFRNKFGKNGGDFRCVTPNETLNDAVNLYAQYSRSSHSVNGPESPNRRSRSLEGLLDKTRSIVAQRAAEVAEKMNNGGRTTVDQQPNETSNGEQSMVADMWEEDSLWRETLRKTSLRHARSLDDLDKEDRVASKSGRQSADILSTSPCETKKAAAAFKKITRDVTYVNDCVSAQIRKAKQNSKEYTEDYREIRKIKRYARTPTTEGFEEDAHYERLDPRATLASLGRQCEPTGPLENMKEHGKDNMQPKTGAQSFLEEGVYPTKPPSFEIDREKLRQWDLMSSAPVAMINAIQRYPDAETHQTDANATSIAPVSDNAPPNIQVSGCDSAIGRSPLPFRNSTPLGQRQVGQGTDNGFLDNGPVNEELHLQNRLNETFNRCLPGAETYAKGTTDNTWNLNVSAGELLGRTHEELVLLLIQLRRQSASICKEMESCHSEIEAQEKLMETDKSKKMKHLNRVEELKKRITELERQYKKGKPLVNLVDNMVKLGSLYRTGPPNRYNQLMDYPLKAKLEFNDRMQEQRLLAEEREEWERVSPDHSQLQAKVEELYKLDRELQQESYLLQSLKQDKDLLEYALSGLKCKIQSTQDNPSEMERYRRQQLHLEQDLSRVRSVLARNSKKLEETVMANGKLEAELVVLRQKLQLSQRPFQENVVAAPTVTALENELKRVQMLVGNLQRQRDELSIQVRQLTEKSKNLCREMRRSSPTAGLSPTLESAAAKKRGTSSWIETDLDNGTVQDFSLPVPYQNSRLPAQSFDGVDGVKADQYGPSVYAKNVSSTVDNFSSICYSVATDSSPSYCEQIDINESDDKMKRFYGILPREKSQEIKTVRIVKRESERRQRDRDRNNVGVPITANSKRLNNTLNETVEEREITDTILTDDQKHSLSRQQCSTNTNLSPKIDVDSLKSGASNPSDISSASVDYNDRVADESGAVAEKSNDTRESPQLTSLYRSKAANEIVEELVLKVNRKGESSRRVMSKEKRRHHTISHNKPILPLDGHNASNNTRSRDDLDMERALRPRLNGTPDVVRSTLCRTEDIAKYDAETIDYVIGTPEKIVIPERYVPENSPELSPEEQDKRLRKAEAIRKMLSETGALSTAANGIEEDNKTLLFRNNLEEKKRQRDHILQLNQILAQQVMQKSKLVAEVGTSHLS